MPRGPRAANPADSRGADPLLLALAAVVLFPVLAALRGLDDNSLTPWGWILEGGSLAGLWALHVAAVALALLLARARLPPGLAAPATAGTALLAVLALAGGPEAVIDASRYFVQAKLLAREGAGGFLRGWGSEVPAWTDLPLVPFVHGALFRVLGEHRAVAQVVGAACLALTTLATAGIGRRLWGGSTGALGGLLLLAAPGMLVQAPLLMADVPAMCAVAAALWALLAALDRGGAARCAVAGALLGAALLTKYSTWVFLPPAFAVVVAARLPARGRPAIVRGLAVLAVGALAPLAYVAVWPGVFGTQLELLAGFQREGLRRWGESPLATFLFQVHPLLAAGAVAAAWRGARTRDAGVLAAAAVPLVLLALGAGRSRYLIPALPMVALLAARGIEPWAPRARRFAALAAVGFSLVTALGLYQPFLRRTHAANLAAAGRFLDVRGVAVADVWVRPSREVPANPEFAIPLLDLHSRARLLARGAAPSPPGERVRLTSPFRFTWEVPLPGWYRAGTGAPPAGALVLVTGEPGAALPAGLRERVGTRPPDAVFDRGAVYRLRTDVLVWLTPP